MPTSPGVRVGYFAGAPIYLRYSWFPLMALVIVGYGMNLASWSSLTTAQGYLAATVVAVTLAAGVFVHELAHATVGRVHGARISSISLTIWGGQTKMQTTSAGASFWVAVSGPAVNFIVAGLCQLLWNVTGTADFFGFTLAAQVNLAIGLFNLIPAFPLDGGFALEALVFLLSGRRSTATRVTAYTGLLLIALLVSAVVLTGIWRSTWMLIVALALLFYLWSGSSYALKALGDNSNPAHPLRASSLAVPTQQALASAPIAQAVQQWDGASPLLLQEERGGQPIGVILPQTLSAAAATLPGQPLEAIALPLAPVPIDSSAGYLDTVDELNGFAHYRNNLQGNQLDTVWLVREHGSQGEHYTGIITARHMTDTLLAQRQSPS